MGSHHGVSGQENAAARAGPLRPGDTLGRWRIDAVLGRGGMGVVYRGSDGDTTRALKLVHPRLLGREQFLKRFQREAGSGARVRHRSTCGARGPRVIAILLTAHADTQMALTAINTRRLHRFFTKPCDGEELRGSLRTLHHLERAVPADRTPPAVTGEERLRGVLAPRQDPCGEWVIEAPEGSAA